ncbi:MAG: penicillin-insensitive murein endopeptidase [Myxococcota bacterium]
MRRRGPGVALGLTLLVAGLASAPAHAASVGTPQDGALRDGFRIPVSGAHHHFAGPVRGRGTQWASLDVAALLARGARTVEERVPGPPLVLGDASVRGGGPVARHASHRSGRDVDVLFYVRDGEGRRVPAPGFRHFDDRGECTDDGCDLRVDVPRTWWLVRTLLASRRPAVQWIFVSDGLREHLLRWARRRGEHPAILRRAERVLRQPSDGAAHDDHLHVRTYCSPRDRADGCEDTGPRWPWVDEDGLARRIR